VVIIISEVFVPIGHHRTRYYISRISLYVLYLTWTLVCLQYPSFLFNQFLQPIEHYFRSDNYID